MLLQMKMMRRLVKRQVRNETADAAVVFESIDSEICEGFYSRPTRFAPLTKIDEIVRYSFVKKNASRIR